MELIPVAQEQQKIQKKEGSIKLTQKLGSGSFGSIYKAFDSFNNKDIAIKIEDKHVKSPSLSHEYKMYKEFSSDIYSVDKGVPKVYSIHKVEKYSYMLMDIMGPSLESQLKQCNRKFKLKTVLMIADQLLQRIEYVHSKKILHRDIKPDNFVVGLEKQAEKVFIIDFGLSKKYITKDGNHIPYKEGKSLTGTSRYASINTHLGIEQSRRDDLEGLGYVLIYLLRGNLPWQGIVAKTKKEQYELILQNKMATSIESLCKGFPVEFQKYIIYCRNLRFTECPDYDFLRNMFKQLFEKMKFENDNVYDWTVKKVLQENKKDEQSYYEVFHRLITQTNDTSTKNK